MPGPEAKLLTPTTSEGENPASDAVACPRRGFAVAAGYFGASAYGSGTTIVRVFDLTVTLFSGFHRSVSRVTVIS
jgi:hypothetical protein